MLHHYFDQMAFLTHGLAKLLKSYHADELVGAAGVPEPLHEELASGAGLLLHETLEENIFVASPLAFLL